MDFIGQEFFTINGYKGGVRPRLYAALLSLLALGLAGCGDSRDHSSSASWSGPPKPSADGTAGVQGFADFAASVDETWEKSPALAAGEFLRLDQTTATLTTIAARSGPEGMGPVEVTVTLDGLLDDSIRSERWQLTFAPEDSTYRLSEARWAQRCRHGRGHTAFSAEPCV
jgi:hypothetical protein